MQRIVFHVGIAKTGTTAIQRSLLASSETLLERRILYPRTGRGGSGLALLAKAVQGRSNPARPEAHQALLAEVRASGASVLVLSSEWFLGDLGGGTAEWARSLSEELATERTQVLVYVRPQWELMETRYAQLVKMGMITSTFPDYIESKAGSRGLDYLWRFRHWSDAFEELDVRPYGPGHLVGDDVVTDFWHAADIGSPPEHSGRYPNRRPGARTIEMLRMIGLALRAEGSWDDRSVRRALKLGRRRIEDELADDVPFRPMTSDSIMRVAERFAASNAELVRRHLGERHASLFSPVEERRASTWSFDDATAHERAVFSAARDEALEEVRMRARRARGRQTGPAPAHGPPARRWLVALRKGLRPRH